MRKKLHLRIAFIFFCVLAVVLAGSFVMATEEANYEVVESEGDFELRQEKIESEYGPAIVRLSYLTEKASEIKAVLEKIRSGLAEAERKKVMDTLDQRMSDEGNLYLRFDKQKAYKGKLALKYTGDVLKARVKIASYPATLSNLKYNAKILFE